MLSYLLDGPNFIKCMKSSYRKFSMILTWYDGLLVESQRVIFLKVLLNRDNNI